MNIEKGQRFTTIPLFLFSLWILLSLPLSAHAATLYFNAAQDTAWNNVNNWWTDPAFTIQSNAVPISTDNVIISADVRSSGATPTVQNLTATGTAAIYIVINVTGTANFYGTGGLPGRIYGTTNFYGSTQNAFFAIIGFVGNYNFFDNSSNVGVVNGNATFNNAAQNQGTVTGNADIYYPSPFPPGGTIYGTIVSHSYTAPTVTVQAASSTTQTSTTLNGTITSTGGVSATTEGFNYGTTTSYGLSASTTGSFSTGAFSLGISGLSCNNTYHYQAYAINSIDTATSSDMTFMTSPCAPNVTTLTPTSISINSATFNGSISSTGGENANQSGFIYSTSPSFTTIIATTTLGAQTGITTFSQSITSLSPATTYYIEAYAANSGGYTYGGPISFTTSAPVVNQSVPSASMGGGQASLAELAAILAPSPAATAYINSRANKTVMPTNTHPSALQFTKNLSIGSTGIDVRHIQQYLNTHGFPVATAGSGSLGKETTIFGNATKKALSAFQKAHGISPAIGYLGSSTRAYINVR